MNQLVSLSCIFLIHNALQNCSSLASHTTTVTINDSFLQTSENQIEQNSKNKNFPPPGKKLATNTRDRGEAPPQTHFLADDGSHSCTALYS